MKGLPTAVYNDNGNVWISFSSPTGGSTDTYLFQMPCLSDKQANEIVDFYRNTFNLPDWSK